MAIDATDIDAAVETTLAKPREKWVPPFLEPVAMPTFTIHVDEELPWIILARAFASQRLSLRWHNGELVLTRRPAEFM